MHQVSEGLRNGQTRRGMGPSHLGMRAACSSKAAVTVLTAAIERALTNIPVPAWCAGIVTRSTTGVAPMR